MLNVECSMLNDGGCWWIHSTLNIEHSLFSQPHLPVHIRRHDPPHAIPWRWPQPLHERVADFDRADDGGGVAGQTGDEGGLFGRIAASAGASGKGERIRSDPASFQRRHRIEKRGWLGDQLSL